MKPDLAEYQGETFAEKVDYCVSAHYVCCKPDPKNEQKDRKDIREECKERVSKDDR